MDKKLLQFSETNYCSVCDLLISVQRETKKVSDITYFKLGKIFDLENNYSAVK